MTSIKIEITAKDIDNIKQSISNRELMKHYQKKYGRYWEEGAGSKIKEGVYRKKTMVIELTEESI